MEGVSSGFELRCLDCSWFVGFEKPRNEIDEDVTLWYILTECGTCGSEPMYNSESDEFECVYCP